MDKFKTKTCIKNNNIIGKRILVVLKKNGYYWEKDPRSLKWYFKRHLSIKKKSSYCYGVENFLCEI